MSRNRAFRLLKDARARASATSVGGASSRVGGHAAVNATNLTRYVHLRALLSKERRICFFCAHFSKNASKTGDPEFVGTVLGGKRARKAFARANNGSANEDKSDGGTFERDFRAIFRSRPFSVFFLSPVGGGSSEVFNRRGLFFLSSSDADLFLRRNAHLRIETYLSFSFFPANSAHPEGVRHVSLQVVQQRMKSVSNIQKITKAMKMVAASRLKPAQDKAMASRGMVTPFFKLLGDLPGVETAKTLMVPISSDKGLCGGINGNVVKTSNVLLETAKDKESEVSMDVIGDKARGLMQRQVGDLFGTVMTDATKQPLTFGTASALAEQVAKDNEGKALIVYNRFVSAISFKPTIATVLSGEEYEKAAENLENKFDSYEVEGPDRAEFLLDLAEFKTGAVMYNALAENNTSELGSRMQSMESSSKNASEMLQKLTLLYNRTRQAAITTELIEIISGASALEDAK